MKVAGWKVLLWMMIGLLITAVIVTVVENVSSGSENNDELQQEAAEDDIPVGLLYSKTGSTAIVEKGMLNAAKMAFDEINAAGEINGKKIRYIEADYSSDPSLAKVEIKKTDRGGSRSCNCGMLFFCQQSGNFTGTGRR